MKEKVFGAVGLHEIHNFCGYNIMCKFMGLVYEYIHWTLVFVYMHGIRGIIKILVICVDLGV